MALSIPGAFNPSTNPNPSSYQSEPLNSSAADAGYSTGPSIAATKEAVATPFDDGTFDDFSTCEISDALLKCGIPHGGYIPDLEKFSPCEFSTSTLSDSRNER